MPEFLLIFNLLVCCFFFLCLLGKMEILENFVLRTCTIITDVRISIYVQQEVNTSFFLKSIFLISI